MERSRTEDIIDRLKELKGARSYMESYWQTLHDYFYIEADNVNRSYASGAELNTDYLWDSTTLEAADVLASGFMNYLTPPSSKWFRLRHKDPSLADNKAVSDYLEKVADEVNYTLNRSNFYNQMFPAYKSSGVLGTSLLLEEEDLDDEARFINLPIKQVCIVEDARGRVCEYYIEFEYTAFQAATRWGKEKLSTEMQGEAENRKDKKYPFLLFIAKRYRRDITKEDKTNMPIEASWIDITNKTLIDESGYNEMPAMCHQFDKRPFIPWGFSPAMKALPFARLLNAISKTNLRGMMKGTDPAVAVPDNAFIMPFNMNPRAVNYYKKDVMTGGGKDMFAIGNEGNPEIGLKAIEFYTQKVRSLMYYDVFLAFEGLEKQMNNPEVMERINEKMSMLGPAVGRYTTQVLNPIIIRTIGILWRRGKLPDPPDEILQDPTYEIDFVGQLAQAQKRSELNSLVTSLQMVGQMATFAPQILDKVDVDKAADEVWSITGAPVRVLRDDAEIQSIREKRSQENAQAQEMAMFGAVAKTGKDAAQADKNMAEAKMAGMK